MTAILFRFDVDAPPEACSRHSRQPTASRASGRQADVPREVGETLELGIRRGAAPFDLRLEQSDDQAVAWRTETFPPHWVGTTIRWDVEAREGGSSVSFRHDGFSDDATRATPHSPGARSWCSSSSTPRPATRARLRLARCPSTSRRRSRCAAAERSGGLRGRPGQRDRVVREDQERRMEDRRPLATAPGSHSSPASSAANSPTPTKSPSSHQATASSCARPTARFQWRRRTRGRTRPTETRG